MNVFRRFPWSGWLTASGPRREQGAPEPDGHEAPGTQQAPAAFEGEDEFDGESWSFWPPSDR